jgi:RND family efflux transporter MFP subunit
MKRMKRRVAIPVIGAAIVIFYYVGEKYVWPPPDNSTIETVGIIEAPEVNITSRIAGRISDLDLLEGDQVERGQVVCRIESIDIVNQLEKAKGDLAKAVADQKDAERTMARDRRLFANEVISAKERDDAVTRVGETGAAVEAASATVQYYTDQLRDTEIRAPINGIVVSKNLEVGEWVEPGTPVMTVDDLSTIWARVDVQETDLGAIRIGSQARVTLPTHPPMDFTGQVMAIGQEGQFATEHDVRRGRQDIRTFYVKVRLLQSEGEAKPGMTAEVSFSRNDGIADRSYTGARTD